MPFAYLSSIRSLMHAQLSNKVKRSQFWFEPSSASIFHDNASIYMGESFQDYS